MTVSGFDETRDRVKVNGLIPRKRVWRRRRALWQLKLRQALPVSDGRITPPFDLDLLTFQPRGDLGMAILVDQRPEPVPFFLHSHDGGDATVVMSDKLVPEASAGLHPIGPGHVMEPEEIFV